MSNKELFLTSLSETRELKDTSQNLGTDAAHSHEALLSMLSLASASHVSFPKIPSSSLSFQAQEISEEVNSFKTKIFLFRILNAIIIFLILNHIPDFKMYLMNLSRLIQLSIKSVMDIAKYTQVK
jgi:hypothetical protein